MVISIAESTIAPKSECCHRVYTHWQLYDLFSLYSSKRCFTCNLKSHLLIHNQTLNQNLNPSLNLNRSQNLKVENSYALAVTGS